MPGIRDGTISSVGSASKSSCASSKRLARDNGHASFGHRRGFDALFPLSARRNPSELLMQKVADRSDPGRNGRRAVIIGEGRRGRRPTHEQPSSASLRSQRGENSAALDSVDAHVVV